MTPSNPVPTNTKIGWTVVQQQEVTEQTAGGKFTRGVRITAQLSDGTPFSIFVPQAQYNQATVKTLLNAQAMVVANIQGLSG
jgi:hypothetical protein